MSLAIYLGNRDKEMLDRDLAALQEHQNDVRVVMKAKLYIDAKFSGNSRIIFPLRYHNISWGSTYGCQQVRLANVSNCPYFSNRIFPLLGVLKMFYGFSIKKLCSFSRLPNWNALGYKFRMLKRAGIQWAFGQIGLSAV